MQSYVYGIIIDCVYYDVGNETTTEIVVERIRHKRRLLIFVIITLCILRARKERKYCS